MPTPDDIMPCSITDGPPSTEDWQDELRAECDYMSALHTPVKDTNPRSQCTNEVIL